MTSIIHSFSLPMIILIGVTGYCLVKYADGTDKLSKANSLCSIDYSIGNFMDKNLLGKFDPTLGQWSNQAFKYFGQACFYTITHVNGAFDSNIKWQQTQTYNTNEHSLALNTNINEHNSKKVTSKEASDNLQSNDRINEDE